MTMKRRLATAATVAVMAGILQTGAVAASNGRGFHLDLPSWGFTGGVCLAFDGDGDCTLAVVTADGVVAGTIDGTGAYHADLVVDFSPGGDCNIVDETDSFAFASGTVFVHSHHEDCRIHGNRIDTDFTITGGTGAYAGASGGGKELGNGGAPIRYNGRFDH